MKAFRTFLNPNMYHDYGKYVIPQIGKICLMGLEEASHKTLFSDQTYTLEAILDIPDDFPESIAMETGWIKGTIRGTGSENDLYRFTAERSPHKQIQMYEDTINNIRSFTRQATSTILIRVLEGEQRLLQMEGLVEL